MPLPMYFVLVFAISWCFSLVPVLASHGVFALSGGASMACLVAGSYGPFLAAFIALYREGGWRAMGGLARRALHWRIAPRCLLAALLLVPCLAFLRRASMPGWADRRRPWPFRSRTSRCCSW
jgi:hypothetical protein